MWMYRRIGRILDLEKNMKELEDKFKLKIKIMKGIRTRQLKYFWS